MLPLLGLSLLGGLMQAQSLTEAQVPGTAVAAFKKSCPGIPAQWNLGPQSTYEAAFSREGGEQVYVYDQAGVLQVKKAKAPLSTMPEGVQSTMRAYPSANTEAAYKVITRTQEKYYEVQFANGGSRERMRFDLAGKPTGKVSLAAAKPVAAPSAQPSKPVAQAPAAPAPKPATPAPAAKPTPQPAMAMRGEAAAPAKPVQNDMLDEDLDDELLDDIEEEEEFEDVEDLDEDMDDDLLLEEEDEDWEDVDDDDLN